MKKGIQLRHPSICAMVPVWIRPCVAPILMRNMLTHSGVFSIPCSFALRIRANHSRLFWREVSLARSSALMQNLRFCKAGAFQEYKRGVANPFCNFSQKVLLWKRLQISLQVTGIPHIAEPRLFGLGLFIMPEQKQWQSTWENVWLGGSILAGERNLSS